MIAFSPASPQRALRQPQQLNLRNGDDDSSMSNNDAGLDAPDKESDESAPSAPAAPAAATPSDKQANPKDILMNGGTYTYSEPDHIQGTVTKTYTVDVPVQVNRTIEVKNVDVRPSGPIVEGNMVETKSTLPDFITNQAPALDSFTPSPKSDDTNASVAPDGSDRLSIMTTPMGGQNADQMNPSDPSMTSDSFAPPLAKTLPMADISANTVNVQAEGDDDVAPPLEPMPTGKQMGGDLELENKPQPWYQSKPAKIIGWGSLAAGGVAAVLGMMGFFKNPEATLDKAAEEIKAPVQKAAANVEHKVEEVLHFGSAKFMDALRNKDHDAVQAMLKTDAERLAEKNPISANPAEALAHQLGANKKVVSLDAHALEGMSKEELDAVHALANKVYVSLIARDADHMGVQIHGYDSKMPAGIRVKTDDGFAYDPRYVDGLKKQQYDVHLINERLNKAFKNDTRVTDYIPVMLTPDKNGDLQYLVKIGEKPLVDKKRGGFERSFDRQLRPEGGRQLGRLDPAKIFERNHTSVEPLEVDGWHLVTVRPTEKQHNLAIRDVLKDKAVTHMDTTLESAADQDSIPSANRMLRSEITKRAMGADKLFGENAETVSDKALPTTHFIDDPKVAEETKKGIFGWGGPFKWMAGRAHGGTKDLHRQMLTRNTDKKEALAPLSIRTGPGRNVNAVFVDTSKISNLIGGPVRKYMGNEPSLAAQKVLAQLRLVVGSRNLNEAATLGTT